MNRHSFLASLVAAFAQVFLVALRYGSPQRQITVQFDLSQLFDSR